MSDAVFFQQAIEPRARDTEDFGRLRLVPSTRLEDARYVAEHYHPYFEETFFVYSGAVTMMLNDEKHELRSGDVVYMPARTIISGRNGGQEEAVIVVVWANLGEPGPLFVYGRPGQPDGAAKP